MTKDEFDENPNEIVIYYNEDPPASGKSEFFKRLIVEEPGRYLLAVPTQKLLDEHAGGKDGLRPAVRRCGPAAPRRGRDHLHRHPCQERADGRSPRRPTSTVTASTSSWSAPMRRS